MTRFSVLRLVLFSTSLTAHSFKRRLPDRRGRRNRNRRHDPGSGEC
jgi:hypothetical protein